MADEVTRGEAATLIVNTMMQGYPFERTGLSDDYRDLWDQVKIETDEISARGMIVEIPNDQALWPDLPRGEDDAVAQDAESQ